MTNYKTINTALLEGTHEIPYKPVHEVFLHMKDQFEYKFVFESKDISPIYGRLSLIGVDPVMKISGKDDTFRIEVLHDRGHHYFDQLTDNTLNICEEIKRNEKSIEGTIPRDNASCEESQRSKKKNIAQVIRIILEKFHCEEHSMLGLYGGLSYDFIRLFEDIPEDTPPNDVNDFTFFLYDTFLYFDHLKEKSNIIVFRESTQETDESIDFIKKLIQEKTPEYPEYSINDASFSMEKSEYEEMVKTAIQYFKDGELLEVVFSNILKAKFGGDPYALYLKYREVNPSPYLFFFDAGDEKLVGASPEMMVRCENKKVHLRPISGTARRGKDPIEDHENMLDLLTNEKERAELDMLIDLGRNDLSRICKPGIEISDYRFVEKYSRVMHTVAHLSGELKDNMISFDALIAALNAGTLTGAPKVAAMRAIEKHEKEKRGYYGGTIGYLTFSGDMDTGIIIRTAHIKGDKLSFQVGATLLYDSVPEKEHQETINKAQAFLDTFSNNLSL